MVGIARTIKETQNTNAISDRPTIELGGMDVNVWTDLPGGRSKDSKADGIPLGPSCEIE